MAGSGRVVCAGIIVVDHVAAPIASMPSAGELVLTDDCILSIGGCASNVACDLGKLGEQAVVAGCVGDDIFGRFAREVLQQAGANTRDVFTLADTATSQTLIVNVKGQDRRFIHHLGANRVFSAKHFPQERIETAKILYVGGYFLMDSLLPNELLEVFQWAKSRGVVTILDVVTPGERPYRKSLETILPATDYFLPNNDEGLLMSGFSDPKDQAKAFCDMGAGTVVITKGGEGAVLLSPKERIQASAFPVDFVDGTGGGDAFDAGFILGLLDGKSLSQCLEIGSALGASCVRKSGATAGVFNRAELQDFLSKNRLKLETW